MIDNWEDLKKKHDLIPICMEPLSWNMSEEEWAECCDSILSSQYGEEVTMYRTELSRRRAGLPPLSSEENNNPCRNKDGLKEDFSIVFKPFITNRKDGTD